MDSHGLVIPAGHHTQSNSNELHCRTGQFTPAENTREYAGLSNPILPTSKPILFILKCIATLDGYEAEELAQEIEPYNYDDLSDEILKTAEVMRESYGSGTLHGVIAEEYQKNLVDDHSPNNSSDIPDFDDPDFFTKLHTDCAPLPDRKRLFVRLWNAFELKDKRAFLKGADPHGAFRRIA